jgi:hypothetical protein
MSYVTSRLNYYNGQFLRKDDFLAEQGYHLAGLETHGRLLHVAGIAEGLDVSINGGNLTVNSGAAVDPAGKQILLDAARIVAVPLTPNATLYATIDYAEQEDLPADPKSIPGNTRLKQVPNVAVVVTPGPASVVLAKITVAAGAAALDKSVRAYSGVALPSPLTPAPTLSVTSDGSEVHLSTNLSVARLKATGTTSDGSASAISALDSTGTALLDLLNNGLIKMSKLAVTRISGTAVANSTTFPMTASFTTTGAPILLLVSGSAPGSPNFVTVMVDFGLPNAFTYAPMVATSPTGGWACSGAELIPGGFAAGTHTLTVHFGFDGAFNPVTGTVEVIFFELPFDSSALHLIAGAMTQSQIATG